jgi:hypothetical protein
MAKNYTRGVRETQLALRTLKDIMHKPLLEAAKQALAPALADLKASAPRDSGLLASRIGMVRARTGNRLKVRFVMGAIGRGKREHKLLSLVSTLLEFGRAPNSDSGKGGFAPRFWMRQSFERTAKQVIATYKAALGPAILRQIAHLNKKR